MKPKFTVLVSGSRNYSDTRTIYKYLNTFKLFCHIKEYDLRVVHGAAKGADSIADQWCKEANVEVKRYPANWAKYGKKAGPLRNQQMLDEEEVDYVIAFPLDNSIGTWDMVDRAKKAGIKVEIIK